MWRKTFVKEELRVYFFFLRRRQEVVMVLNFGWEGHLQHNEAKWFQQAIKAIKWAWLIRSITMTIITNSKEFINIHTFMWICRYAHTKESTWVLKPWNFCFSRHTNFISFCALGDCCRQHLIFFFQIECLYENLTD